jgi:hypothetical protein
MNKLGLVAASLILIAGVAKQKNKAGALEIRNP